MIGVEGFKGRRLEGLRRSNGKVLETMRGRGLIV